MVARLPTYSIKEKRFIRQMSTHLFKNSFIRGFWKTTPKGFLQFQGSRSGHFKALRNGGPPGSRPEGEGEQRRGEASPVRNALK